MIYESIKKYGFVYGKIMRKNYEYIITYIYIYYIYVHKIKYIYLEFNTRKYIKIFFRQIRVFFFSLF